MSFEDKPTEQLIRIARAGLGFVLDQNSKSSEDVQKIMNAATFGGAIITLTDEPDHLGEEIDSRYR